VLQLHASGTLKKASRYELVEFAQAKKKKGVLREQQAQKITMTQKRTREGVLDERGGWPMRDKKAKGKRRDPG